VRCGGCLTESGRIKENPMSDPNLVNTLAARLRDAEASRNPIAPVRGEVPLDEMATAYAVQQANVDARIANGEHIVGRRIGLTSLAVQKQLGVDQPDFGALFADMAYGDSEPILLKTLIQPKVEAEIALVFERDLTHEKHTYVDILRASADALAAIEVVDSRIENWDIRFVDTVADNASSARFVLGSRPVPLSQIDLTACAMTLARDGEVLSRGSGTACLGNPLNAAVWLADRMAQLGTPLRAGDVVLTVRSGRWCRSRKRARSPRRSEDSAASARRSPNNKAYFATRPIIAVAAASFFGEPTERPREFILRIRTASLSSMPLLQRLGLSWVVGDEPYVSLHVLGADRYAR
jgi:2-keto-4-pentenoate hydratase